jgi:hypothetical protein
VNLTEATDRQVEFLEKQGFGSFTQVVRTAIDRMYREEHRKENKMGKRRQMTKDEYAK